VNNVSGSMRRRSLVVAALGILFGVFLQASLTDASRCRLPMAPGAGRSNLEPACATAAGKHEPRNVAPAFSQVQEIARFDVQAVSK
jgi:hypothetical protein